MYIVLEDGTAEITGYNGTEEGNLNIPENLGGCTVTSIGDEAFFDCEGFTGGLTLPDSLISIGDYAFSGCSGFTGDLIIPESVTSIGNGAFLDFSGFTVTGRKLSLSKNITTLGPNAFFDSIGIALPRNEIHLLTGDTGTLQVQGGIWTLDTNSPYPLVTFKSSNEGVVKIDKDGKYKAVSVGEATITAIGYNQRSATITMKVLPERASGFDTIAPMVRGISFQPFIMKPGVIKFKVELLEEDTGIIGFGGTFLKVYDSSSDYITFSCNWESAPKFSGTYEISVPVSSKKISGEYYLNEFWTKDEAGNFRGYGNLLAYSDSISYGHSGSVGIWIDGSAGVYINVNDGRDTVSVQDEFDVSFQASITNPAIDERLKEMPDDSTAMIDFNQNNHIAKWEWFEVIKATNKNLVLSNDGIQWMFNGKDITETKDIDCAISIQNTYDYTSGNTGALKLIFAPNGVLPGKATVRIKSDYISNLYGVSQKLYLYFLKDDQTLQLEDMPQYFMDGSDYWCEFELTHNSTFVLSGIELDTQQPNTPQIRPQKQTEAPSTSSVPAAKIKVGKAAISSLKNSKKKAAVLKLKKVSGAKGYEVVYSTNKKFKKDVKTKSTKKLSLTLKKLKKNKTYYVKVRAYKLDSSGAKVYGKYSKVKKVKIRK